MASGSLVFAIAGFGGSPGPQFHWAQTSASAARRGLFLSSISGSPPLSFVAQPSNPSTLVEGDVWYRESGSSGDGNLFIAEKTLLAGVVVSKRFVTAREGETTIAQVVSRFATPDAPSDLIVGLNGVVIDNFFVTVNTSSVSGALVRNETWGGGLYMPDPNTVAVSGSDKDFFVPSGSFIVEVGSVTLNTGSLTVNSGSISLIGDSVEFSISGSNVTASLRGNPIMSLKTGSVDSASLASELIEGTMYVNTSSRDVSVKASGTLFDLDVDAPDLIDGGSY
jgi:hypothetical protein